jgi:glutathionyl-hydroquinone reductase
MLNNAFDDIGALTGDFYPKALRAKIDNLSNFIYSSINNGVYRAGFAGTQKAYDEVVVSLFNALSQLEERLASKRYLTGDTITEADWRLFTTLIRFDPVYFGHLKCNICRLVDCPNLWGLHQRSLPGAGNRRNHRHRPHQSTLLRQSYPY